MKGKDFFINIDYFFGFLGVSLLLIEFPRLANDSLILFTIFSFLFCLSLYKYFTKNEG